jgi:mRNA-degrading endonuclease RelE of RelBE toxin-antitoxin system
MSEGQERKETAPDRIAVVWSLEARSGLRAIDRETAMQILYYLDRYLSSRTGDVKKLKPPLSGFRLRCGDYRVFFDQRGENAIEITSILDRKDAYR